MQIVHEPLIESSEPPNRGFLNGAGQDRLGIYIKSVVKGGAADVDGRLLAGDQLLKVDGQSLVGITQEKAAEYLVRTGPIVTLEVAKQGAIYHGLATLLSQPSPVMARAPSPYHPMEPRRDVLPCEGYTMDPYGYYHPHVPPQSCPGRPGSPTVLTIQVPILKTRAPCQALPNNYLTVPSHPVTYYKVIPDGHHDLQQDIFQENQAKLVNCDSEDASAFLHQRKKVDVVRFQKPIEEEVDEVPHWFHKSIQRAQNVANLKDCCRWVDLKDTKVWKSDIHLTKSGIWEMVDKDSDQGKPRSKSCEDLFDTLSSSSDCGCELSVSPLSTDSQSERVYGVAENIEEGEKETIFQKLTSEEREKTLRELDEIIHGIEKIKDFGNKQVQGEGASNSKMTDFLESMLKTEAAQSPPGPSNVPSNKGVTSSSSSTSGDLEYGSGRVAALAKHFSKMGEAGIIRGRGGTRGRGISRGQCKSEPNISRFAEPMEPKPGDLILPLSAFNSQNPDRELVLATKGLSPVGFSMDRLIDLGHGVIMFDIPKESFLGTESETKMVEPKYKDQGTQTAVMGKEEGKQILSSPGLHRKMKSLEEPPKVEATPFMSPCRKKSPKLSHWRKSISVDEIEMRLRDKSPTFHKHYSLIELPSIDKENKEVGVQTANCWPANRRQFCPSESIHQAYMGCSSFKDTRQWMSVDDSFFFPSWADKIKEKERLDLGSSKDALRRLHKADVIKGRKMRRAKKLELQRSFVVTPVKTGSGSFESDPNTLQWTSLDERDESRPRRMSERDLPSRVLSEQQNHQVGGRAQLPPHPPQMLTSKSVPSLNTGGHDLDRPVNQPSIGNSTMPRPNHEVFNPGYSRTSSTNSIPQKAYDGHPQHHNPNQIRSRSSQNLTDGRQMGQSIGGRQPSGANLMANNYNGQPPMAAPHHQPPPSMSHMYPGGPPPPHQGQGQQHLPFPHAHPPPHQLAPHHNSPVAADNGERFYQNLSVYRNHEVVHNGYLPHSAVGRGKLPSPQEERSAVHMQNSLRGSQSSLQSRSTEPIGNITNRDRPASAYLPSTYTNMQMPPQGMQARSQSSRDVLRQEAKIQEMTEEVRRREARVTSPQNTRPPVSVAPPIQGSPLRYVGGGHENYQQQPRGVQQVEYSDSPPPPPPPPTSTHPLYQSQPRNDTLYAASGSDPPRVSLYPLSPTSQQQRQYNYQGTNPWQREEREREVERRRDMARHWRDQQIEELSSLPHRNQQQEEQLRALKLDKEFERRAEELEEEDEEDQEATERVQGLLRVAHQNDERRSLRTPQPPALSQVQAQPQHHGYLHQGPPPQTHTHTLNGPSSQRPPSSGPQYNQISAEEKARLQRLKELKMKQAEVEAERMKKKQEEEMRNQSLHSTSYQSNVSRGSLNQSTSSLRTPPSNLRLDNLVINTPGSANNNNNNTNHYHNNNGYSSSQASPAGQRLDTLVGGAPNSPPQPPERGSSFAVMSTASLRSPQTPSATSTPPTMATAKRVSFQDPSPPTPPSNTHNTTLDNIREDPNHFINEAESFLASPTSPDTPFTGNTPGVIGAQEVYRDPRQKRLAEQQHQKLLSNKVGPVPEKLSFKEKMKMFAMETGEDGTPKDKVKISRAQRDIDNLGSPASPNNNN